MAGNHKEALLLIQSERELGLWVPPTMWPLHWKKALLQVRGHYMFLVLIGPPVFLENEDRGSTSDIQVEPEPLASSHPVTKPLAICLAPTPVQLLLLPLLS